jgi:hypothetical protein
MSVAHGGRSWCVIKQLVDNLKDDTIRGQMRCEVVSQIVHRTVGRYRLNFTGSPSDCDFRDLVRLSVCKKCAERMKSNSDGTGREVRAFRPAIARQNSLDKVCSLNIGCEISVVRSRQGNTSRDKSAAVVAAVDN